jgi:hypothetical protein
MSNAVIARWHGDNYQARIFWMNALNLLRPHSCVVEVTFEANGPKSFDDIVVRYDPPVAGSGPDPVTTEYHQVKWHVQTGGRFGYEDFVDPAFIGATSMSLLQRLKDARQTAPASARFAFLTTDRIRDDDPLGAIISNNDKTVLLEKLFDGTTDQSRMGKVRKLWRQHLGLASDDELRAVVSGLRVFEGYLSLQELRDAVNVLADIVGAVTCSAADSDFRYDELARQLKVRSLNTLTKDALLKFCQEHGLLTALERALPVYRPVAIRSFLGPAADVSEAAPEDTLVLTEHFRQRYLRDDLGWQKDIGPRVYAFLREVVRKSSQLRLILDAHASIAFLAGSILDTKSAVQTELVQKGRVGAKTWRTDDGTSAGAPSFVVTEARVGDGPEIAVAISVAQAVEPQARACINRALPHVGRILSFSMPNGPGLQTVIGGGHAAALAEQAANSIRGLKVDNPDAAVHIFAACPNALLFFLGQHHQGIAPCVVYEFDFDRKGNKTYQPSFAID